MFNKKGQSFGFIKVIFYGIFFVIMFDLCGSAFACTVASKIIIDAFNDLDKNEEGS